MSESGSVGAGGATVPAPVSVGIIGCGRVAENAYLPLLVSQIAQGHARPPTVCGVSPDRLAEVRAGFEIAVATTDPGEIINDPALTGLLGPCTAVTAMARISRPQRIVDGERIDVEVDDIYELVLELGDGVLATGTTAFGMHQCDSPAVEIYGQIGRAHV